MCNRSRTLSKDVSLSMSHRRVRHQEPMSNGKQSSYAATTHRCWHMEVTLALIQERGAADGVHRRAVEPRQAPLALQQPLQALSLLGWH